MLFVFLPFSFLPDGVKIAGYATRATALNLVSAFTFFLFFLFSGLQKVRGRLERCRARIEPLEYGGVGLESSHVH
jgi:hypothetical protein